MYYQGWIHDYWFYHLKIDQTVEVNNRDNLENSINEIFCDTDDTECDSEGIKIIHDDYTEYKTTNTNANNNANNNNK